MLLRREGWQVNAKRVWRLYREESLQLRNKSPKRRVKAKLREGRSSAAAPNEVWAMDFVHDQLFDGRKIRALTVIDTFTRLSPAIEFRQTWRRSDVAVVLDRAAAEVAYPAMIRVDNHPEFVSRQLDLWAFVYHVTIDFSRPGKPTDNAFLESFNGEFRSQCLTRTGSSASTRHGRNARLGVETTTKSGRTAHSALGNNVPAARHRTAGKLGRPAVRLKPEFSWPSWSTVGGKFKEASLN